jgi:hypothetical protein
MPKQIFIIHGGEVFESYDKYFEYLKNYKIDFENINHHNWKDDLQKVLGNDYQVIFPEMPSRRNAKYVEWKIWFEKFFPILNDEIILVGNSLGSTFLAKYLSENNFPVKIKGLFLLAGPFDAGYLGDFNLSESLINIENQVKNIFLFHSEDDPYVPISEVKKYSQAFPNAEKIIFKNKGHFNLKEFPEFVEKLRSIK